MRNNVTGCAMLAVLALLLGTRPAGAAAFSFAYSIDAGVSAVDGSTYGTAITASGVLTAELREFEVNVYDVTSITGTRNGEAITGLLPPDSFNLNNNRLYVEYDANRVSFAGPYLPGYITTFLDGLGLSYTVAGLGDDGLGNVNVYAPSGRFDAPLFGFYTESNDDVGYGRAFSVSGLDVPEPASAALVAVVLIGAGLARRLGHPLRNRGADATLT